MHVSGCAKGCAHPTLAPLTIVGTEQGCGIVANDTARATPSTHLDPNELVSVLGGSGRKKREAVNA